MLSFSVLFFHGINSSLYSLQNVHVMHVNEEDRPILLAFSLCFYLSLSVKLVSTFLLLLKKTVWTILARERVIILIEIGGSAGKT